VQLTLVPGLQLAGCENDYGHLVLPSLEMVKSDNEVLLSRVMHVPYLFTSKPSLAISRDPKLVRHDSGRKLSEKKRKNIGY